MERVYLSSTDLRSVVYDNEFNKLEIEFNSGGVYVYSGVPSTVYHDLISAPSHEKYFHARIKDVYPHNRLR